VPSPPPWPSLGPGASASSPPFQPSSSSSKAGSGTRARTVDKGDSAQGGEGVEDCREGADKAKEQEFVLVGEDGLGLNFTPLF